MQNAEIGNPLPTDDCDTTFSYTQSGRKGTAIRTFHSEDGGVVVGITAYRRFRARHPKVLTPGQWASTPPPPPPPHP